MIRAAEYKDNAQECRELAKQMLRPEDREALERIAQIWERLAIVPELHPEPELEPETATSRRA
jgi:hypothetical protein